MSTVLIVGGGVLNKYKITALHVTIFRTQGFKPFFEGANYGGGRYRTKYFYKDFISGKKEPLADQIYSRAWNI